MSQSNQDAAGGTPHGEDRIPPGPNHPAMANEGWRVPEDAYVGWNAHQVTKQVLESDEDFSGIRIAHQELLDKQAADGSWREGERPLAYGRDDEGNARRLAYYAWNELRYVKTRKQWYTWDGRRWAKATDADVIAVGRRVAGEILREAQELTDDAQRATHAAHAVKSHSARAIKAMIELATGDRWLWIDDAKFDTNPYLVNFTNCTLDVRTLQWHLHQRSDLITKLVPHAYDPTAACPRYEALVARTLACADGAATCDFVHKALGYSALVGRNYEQKIFFLIGPSNSGKSKLVEVPKAALGADYAHKSKPDLISRKREHHDSEKLSIVGKRFVTISETSSLFNLDEQVVKEITGDREVPTRKLYTSDERDALVTWKIWLVVNDFPNVLEWDDAIKRRVVPIPCGEPIPANEIIPDLDEQILRDEVVGVLAYLVQGAHRWYLDWSNAQRYSDAAKTGLLPPLDVETFKEEYAASQDHIGRFIDECVVLDAESVTPMKDVHAAFKRWRGVGEVSNRNRLYGRVRELKGVTVNRDKFHGLKIAGATWQERLARAGEVK
jgi:P4 family phage/plasmid primase-like protien